MPLLDRQERCQVKLQYKGLKRDMDDTTVGTKRRNLAGDVNYGARKYDAVVSPRLSVETVCNVFFFPHHNMIQLKRN